MDKMIKIKLSRLYWTIALSLFACSVGGVSLCSRFSLELGVTELETLCDLEFCTCHDPFGRVRCVCPGEDKDEELVIKAKGSCSVPLGATSLSLNSCKKITVIKEGFEELRDLKILEFVNIKEVSIQAHSFHSNGPPRNINFTNSTIPELTSFTFTGHIKSVLFDNCYIGVIRAFAFSSIENADSIILRGTNVANVEAQAFKKFAMNKLIIIDSQFNVIPSRFIVDVVIEILFKIDSSFIDVVRTSGFKVFNPKKVIIVNTLINKLHPEAFKIVSKGEIVITSNIINSVGNEAFRGLSVEKYVVQESGKQKLKFQNQTITSFDSKSLYFNRSIFEVQISRLMIDEACTCDRLVLWKDMITIGKKQVEPLEVELESIWCHMDDRKEENFDYVQGHDFYKEYCNKLTTSIYFFVVIITTTAISIVIVVTIVACVLRRRKKWKPVPSSAKEADQNGHKKTTKGMKKHVKRPGNKEVVKPEVTKGMIVPDGRTYKETEFHIIVEKAEPLDNECVPYTVVRDRSRSQVN